MPDFPKMKGFPTGRGASDRMDAIGRTVRSRGFSGPPIPAPLESTPHQDLGLAVSNLWGDVQGVGVVIQGMLDQPFDSVSKGMKGPHRWVDAALNFPSGISRNVVLGLTQNR